MIKTFNTLKRERCWDELIPVLRDELSAMRPGVNPRSRSRALNLLVDSLMEMDRFSEALPLAWSQVNLRRRCHSLRITVPGAFFTLGVCLECLGRLPSASRAYRMALEVCLGYTDSPISLLFRVALIRTDLKLGLLEQASIHVAEALNEARMYPEESFEEELTRLSRELSALLGPEGATKASRRVLFQEMEKVAQKVAQSCFTPLKT